MLELQAGWRHGGKKSSVELEREAEAQAKREGEVEDILMNRPRVVEEGRGSSGRGAGVRTTGVGQELKGGVSRTSVVETEEVPVFVNDGSTRRSTDIQEMLSRRFGNVRQGTLAA